MNLLSIQSHVAYGHVGNSAAVFPLQRLGVEVWPVNTVQFSNHTGYGKWRGEVYGAAQIREVIEGIAERGVLKTCDGVISGYLGTAEIGEVVLETVAKVKAANKRALYCCDPVIGDGGKAYVQSGIAEFFSGRALAAADVLTPNQFELEKLSGIKVRSMADAAQACDALHAKGPKTVLVTSLKVAGTPRDALDIFASGEGERCACGCRSSISRCRAPATRSPRSSSSIFCAPVRSRPRSRSRPRRCSGCWSDPGGEGERDAAGRSTGGVHLAFRNFRAEPVEG